MGLRASKIGLLEVNSDHHAGLRWNFDHRYRLSVGKHAATGPDTGTLPCTLNEVEHDREFEE